LHNKSVSVDLILFDLVADMQASIEGFC